MKPFLGREPCDVMEEHHKHWAVGWVDGYAIRVFRRGRITKAFRTWHDLQQRLADYPILDEDDYSNRVYEATLENIADAAWRLKRDYDLPSDWAFQVYRWLSDHDCSEIENDDDRGGYPSEEWLCRAFDGLGIQADRRGVIMSNRENPCAGYLIEATKLAVSFLMIVALPSMTLCRNATSRALSMLDRAIPDDVASPSQIFALSATDTGDGEMEEGIPYAYLRRR